MEEPNPREAPLDTQESIVTTSKGKQLLPLALGEGHLLEVLSEKLSAYLSGPDIQMVLDSLRDELYADLDTGSIDNLHLITRACRKCPALEADPQLPAWNKSDPDCLLVLDNPKHSKDVVGLIVSALTAAKFSSKRVCLTYLNRCRPVQDNKCSTQEMSNCLGYLQTEIQIMRPKLIVPMGAASIGALLGTQAKLADVHGKVMWLGPWAIMPAYSPQWVLHLAGDKQKDMFNKDIEHAYQFCYGEPIRE